MAAAALMAVMPLAALDLTRKINVAGSNLSVRELLRQVEEQTGYTFAFNKSTFDLSRRVDIRASQAEIGDVMNALLDGTGSSYTVNNKHIVIIPVKEEVSAGVSRKATAPRQAKQEPSGFTAGQATGQVAGVSAAQNLQPLPNLPVVKADELYMQVVDNSVYMDNRWSKCRG